MVNILHVFSGRWFLLGWLIAASIFVGGCSGENKSIEPQTDGEIPLGVGWDTAVTVAIFAVQQYQIATAPDPQGRVLTKLDDINSAIGDLQTGIDDIKNKLDSFQSDFARAYGVTITSLDELGTQISQVNATKAVDDIEEIHDINFRSLINILKDPDKTDSDKVQAKKDFIDAVFAKDISGSFTTIANALYNPRSGSVFAALTKESIDKYNAKYLTWNSYGSEEMLYSMYMGMEYNFAKYLIFEGKAYALHKLAIQLSQELDYKRNDTLKEFDEFAQGKLRNQADEWVYQVERLVLNTTKLANTAVSKLTPGYEKVFARADFMHAQMLGLPFKARGRVISATQKLSGPISMRASFGLFPLKSSMKDSYTIPYEQNRFQGQTGSPGNPTAGNAIDDWSTANGLALLSRATEWTVEHYESELEDIPVGEYEVINSQSGENITNFSVNPTCIDNYQLWKTTADCELEHVKNYGGFSVVVREGGTAAVAKFWKQMPLSTPSVKAGTVTARTFLSSNGTGKIGTLIEYSLKASEGYIHGQPIVTAEKGVSVDIRYRGEPSNLSIYYSVTKEQSSKYDFTIPSFNFGLYDIKNSSYLAQDNNGANSSTPLKLSISTKATLNDLSDYAIILRTALKGDISKSCYPSLCFDEAKSSSELKYLFVQF